MHTGTIEAPKSLVALPFRPVDVEGQAKAWRLRENGDADGRANIPPPGTDRPSTTEQQIRVFIDAERTRLANDLTAHLRAQNDALSKLETAMDIAALRKDCAQAVSQLEATHVAWKADILRLLRAARAARDEYNAFRNRHSLIRPARPVGHRGIALCLLALFVIIEGAFNGVFFAEGSDAGLVGGIIVALSVSLVNVVLLGFLLGFGPARWTQHRSPLLRVVAYLMLAGGAALLVVVNAFVGHYRDAYEEAGDALRMLDVWDRLAVAPLDFARLQSWLLFFLGLGFAGLGFAKGRSLDDPYPGYGPVARRWEAAEQDYLANRSERLADATAVRDGALTAVGTAIEHLRGAAQQREQIMGQRARMAADFANHEAHLAEAANALLEIYRAANRSMRSQPEPDHFREAFAFEGSVLDQSNLRALMNVRPPPFDIDWLLSELDRLREAVLAAYRLILDDAPADI